MDPFTGVASAVNLVGSIRQNSANRREARQARAFNQAEAQKARDFAERMSNTSYQRAMTDMRSAGLNPMLAYQKGGASTPSAAAASGPMARAENETSGAVNSALAGRRMSTQLKLEKEQLATQQNLTDKAGHEARKAATDADYQDDWYMAHGGLSKDGTMTFPSAGIRDRLAAQFQKEVAESANSAASVGYNQLMYQNMMKHEDNWFGAQMQRYLSPYLGFLSGMAGGGALGMMSRAGKPKLNMPSGSRWTTAPRPRGTPDKSIWKM